MSSLFPKIAPPLLLTILFFGCEWTASVAPTSPFQFIGTPYQEEAIDLAFLSDGDILITGHSNAPSQGLAADVVFYLLDSERHLKRTRRWGQDGPDQANTLRLARDGATWMAATLAKQDTQEMRLLKFPQGEDTLLTFNWMRHEGSFSTAVDVLESQNGDLIYLGTEWDNANNPLGLLLFRIAPDGSLKWPQSRTYRLQGQKIQATHLLEVPDGSGFIIVASTETDGLSGQNLLLIRTNSNGIVTNQRVAVVEVAETDRPDFPVQLLPWPSQGKFILLGYSQLENGLSQSFHLTADWDLGNQHIQPIGPAGFRAKSQIGLGNGEWVLGGSYQESPNADWNLGLLPLHSDLSATGQLARIGYENDEVLVDIASYPSEPGKLLILANVDFQNGNQMIGLLKTDTDGNLTP